MRILKKDNSHILKVYCVVHVLNLIAKKIVNNPIMDPVVKGNKTLVNYFTNAGFWRKHLTTWQKEKKNVCMGPQEHEGGFWKCLEIHCDPLIYTPSMTTTVINVIEDWDHFTANQTLVSLLKPVVDAIGNLKQAQTTLANIWKHLLHAYKSIQHVDVYSQFQPFNKHCINILHSQTTIFHDEIYIIGFFLHPGYHHISVSKSTFFEILGK
ncbi:hypothetical protein VP01_176g1 [Puccinia sorghi]|uniref:DUF659 domain-containing protein n=1 Tax=Puccinia sorghi TaxID=27349 RepID=A0A0L6VGM4_9BASI|nr:hypothetical protein VP01_176g1 [Puccinia sorghi]